MKNILSWLGKLVINTLLIIFVAFCVVYMVACIILALPIFMVLIVVMAVQENDKPFKIVP